jgi:hypothetical protein
LDGIQELARTGEFTIAASLPKRQKNIDTFMRLKYVPPYINKAGECYEKSFVS